MKPRIPENPVDKLILRWWTLGDYDVIPHHAVYHVNTKWNDLYPDSRPGADFEDQWQIFYDGRFSGRSNQGWKAMEAGDWSRCFSTEVEARQVLCDRLRERIVHLKDEIVDRRQALVANKERLGALLYPEPVDD
jgi:hypothetical protein